jgi:tRNA U34 5-methylaminomethyl-2-thiouridine-forming methyltransferase MnmC
MSTNDHDRTAPRQPEIVWDESGTPIASRFGDPYYSRDDGRAETRHVFLDLNGLPARWAQADTFTIAELGFGTGLNFFETLVAWRSAPRPSGARLSYVSFELYPLSASDLKRAISVWPDFGADCDRLLAHWPSTGDTLEVTFDGGADLEIRFGDVNEILPAWHDTADAWFLDGFSPAKNADMWGVELMHSVYAHTKQNGTFATFTAAGWVRRNLAAAGFMVEKATGYGRKRECARGTRAVQF